MTYLHTIKQTKPNQTKRKRTANYHTQLLRRPELRHFTMRCDAMRWGEVVLQHEAEDKRINFAPKAIKCIMIGYSESSKAWRLWDTERKRLIVSRDVTFNESVTLNVSVVITQSVAADTVEVPVTSVQASSEQVSEEK